MRWIDRPSELAAEADHDRALNSATRVSWSRPAGGSLPVAFRHAYPQIRRSALEFAQTGVGLFAVDLATRGYLGALCLPSQAGGLATGVLGRHTQSPLHVATDTAIALRQLLCVVEPPTPEAEIRERVRFRLLDLNSSFPPTDEEGRRLASLSAEGPVILRLGTVGVFALPTGDPTDWPERAADAWAQLPERIYFEERLADGSNACSLPKNPTPPVRDPHTTLVRVRQPVAALHAAPDDGPAIAQLAIDFCHRALRFPIPADRLERGILIGRYARCPAGGVIFGEASCVSRVHAIVLSVAGTPWLIDTASTNGLWRGTERHDVLPLVPDQPIRLGEETTDPTLRWLAG